MADDDDSCDCRKFPSVAKEIELRVAQVILNPQSHDPSSALHTKIQRSCHSLPIQSKL